MALTNRDRVQRGLDLLRAGLAPFVEREFKARLGVRWPQLVDQRRRYDLEMDRNGNVSWDNSALLGVMLDQWNDVFRLNLDPSHRTLVHELKDVRNAWAHDKPFSTDATYRALDSAKLLLDAVSAAEQAREVERHAHEVLRTKFAEQARTEGRRVEAAGGNPESGLPSWREVITPHEDVYLGRYEQAEFAADLAQVARGEGADEYRDPREFFRRTFLTEGLRRLLGNALRRLSGLGGDPVVELQTNFGGGKTHSMLALYHLFSGVPSADLLGVEPLLHAAGLSGAPTAQRAVLVGTSLSAGSATTKPDGTVVRTLWGEMAWQLGGADGYAMVREADETGTSPGSAALADLFSACSPCLILIDEWVAFLRNLYGVRGLPAGSFESNVFFVQALTEAARAARGTMVVATLPASQIEIGGEGGEEALAVLEQTFGRMESTWKPATAEEGFEIVRRRLFQENTENQAARDLVAKRFSEAYRSHGASFPSACGEAEYRERLKRAYPIHPELFDRLYNDWSSLEKFQRTRGVLRLMASVIHALWEGEDRNLLIMPSTVPVDNYVVRFELTRHMDDPWDAVIAKDVDGPGSLPVRLDRENPNLGHVSAARRVARALYLGSAPTSGAATPGIDQRSVLLACAQPGEQPAAFGDALRRLTDGATYLYVDEGRYWYSTQPSVARLARDRAAQLEDDDVEAEIVRRLKEDKKRGEFARVHVAPGSSSEVADEKEARLVVLGPSHPHAARDEGSEARVAAKAILDARGASPRLFRNTLVFLAPDRQRLRDLEGSVRRYLAWSSVERDREALNLTHLAANQAATKRREADAAVAAQVGEAWSWCLVPEQPEPLGETGWTDLRVGGGDPMAERATRKLVPEELLLPAMGPARLGMELKRTFWKDHDHVGVAELYDYLCRFLYLPRLKEGDVLLGAVRKGLESVVPSDDFAYAEAYDGGTGRYAGLRTGGEGAASVIMDGSSVLVKPEAARRQLAAEEAEREERRRSAFGNPAGAGAEQRAGYEPTSDDGDPADRRWEFDLPVDPPVETTAWQETLKRFYAVVELDPDRVGRDAGRIADEVLSHLTALPGARLKVSLEIEAELPEGAPEEVRRTVTENATVLKFGPHGFERE